MISVLILGVISEYDLMVMVSGAFLFQEALRIKSWKRKEKPPVGRNWKKMKKRKEKKEEGSGSSNSSSRRMKRRK